METINDRSAAVRERREEYLRLRAAGKTIRECAAELGVPPTTLANDRTHMNQNPGLYDAELMRLAEEAAWNNRGRGGGAGSHSYPDPLHDERPIVHHYLVPEDLPEVAHTYNRRLVVAACMNQGLTRYQITKMLGVFDSSVANDEKWIETHGLTGTEGFIGTYDDPRIAWLTNLRWPGRHQDHSDRNETIRMKVILPVVSHEELRLQAEENDTTMSNMIRHALAVYCWPDEEVFQGWIDEMDIDTLEWLCTAAGNRLRNIEANGI